jgi:hypothetical protein
MKSYHSLPKSQETKRRAIAFRRMGATRWIRVPRQTRLIQVNVISTTWVRP